MAACYYPFNLASHSVQHHKKKNARTHNMTSSALKHRKSWKTEMKTTNVQYCWPVGNCVNFNFFLRIGHLASSFINQTYLTYVFAPQPVSLIFDGIVVGSISTSVCVTAVSTTVPVSTIIRVHSHWRTCQCTQNNITAFSRRNLIETKDHSSVLSVFMEVYKGPRFAQETALLDFPGFVRELSQS